MATLPTSVDLSAPVGLDWTIGISFVGLIFSTLLVRGSPRPSSVLNDVSQVIRNFEPPAVRLLFPVPQGLDRV